MSILPPGLTLFVPERVKTEGWDRHEPVWPGISYGFCCYQNIKGLVTFNQSFSGKPGQRRRQDNVTNVSSMIMSDEMLLIINNIS